MSSTTRWPQERRTASALVLGSWLLLAGCSSDSPIQVGADVQVEVTSGGGSGSGRVVSNASTPPSFTIDCTIDPTGATGSCSDSFRDAGGGGSFELNAVPGAGSRLTAWIGCDDPTSTALSCALSFPPGAGVGADFDVAARFDVDPCFDVKASVPNSTTGTGPATPTDLSPGFGVEALANPSFEQVVTIGTAGEVVPSFYGYWQGDLNSRVESQQGIDPAEGSHMVQFIATGLSAGPTGTAELIQLVKVSHLSGPVRATLSARFNRVAGCAETDTNMLMVVAAMPGDPSEAQARWTVGSNANRDDEVAGGWLKRFRAGLVSNGDPADWELLELVADLPEGTTYVVVDIGASENVVNDEGFPELHGHYVDDASLVFTSVPPS